MKWLVGGGVALIMALASALAGADARASLSGMRPRGLALDVIPACRVPEGVVASSDLKSVPAGLRDAVRQKFGEVVAPGAPFDATDVVTTGHFRRLIFVWQRGNRWVVATEHGGLGYNDPILAYSVRANGQWVRLVAERIALPKTVCSTAEGLL
jgi:hypothetical protein